MATKNSVTVSLPEARYLALIAAEAELNAIKTGKPAMGFKTAKVVAVETPKAEKVVKVQPVASQELRLKVARQIESDARNVLAKGDRKYDNGKYFFNGFTATKVGYAAISTRNGQVDPSSMKDATVLAIAKDYGIK